MDAAATEYRLPRILLLAIIKTESGGNVRAVNFNKNGTRDVGPMQVNSLWVKVLERKYGLQNVEHHLRQDPCYNIRVGAWILKQQGIGAGPMSSAEFWRRVGAYHSRTPRLNRRYALKVYENYRWLITHYAWWFIKNNYW